MLLSPPLLLAMVLSAAVMFAAAASSSDDPGFVGVVGQDLHVNPPSNGRVIVDGADVNARADRCEADLKMLRKHVCQDKYVVGNVDIDSNGATDFYHFRIGSTSYLALSSFFGPDTTIYRQDAASGQFTTQVQSITVSLSPAVAHVAAGGNDYLAVCQEFSGGQNTVNSKVYKFNTQSEQFESFQDIPTIGCQGVLGFQMNGVAHLAFSNQRDADDWKVDSEVLAWSDTTGQFESLQTFGRCGYSFVYYEIGEQPYLVCSKWYDGATYELPVLVHAWNSATGAFDEVQTLAGKGAQGLQHFAFDGKHYLLVNNFRDDASNPQSPAVYAWNAETKLFAPRQELSWVKAVVGVHFFEINGRGYAAIAPGNVHEWDSSSGQLQTAPSVELDVEQGANFKGIDYFAAGSRHYLAIAIARDAQNDLNAQSPVFELTSVCW